MPNRPRRVEDVIAFTQSADFTIRRGVAADTAFNVSDLASTNLKPKVADNALELSDALSINTIASFTFFDGLFIQQEVTASRPVAVSLVDTLTLTQSLDQSIKAGIANSTLTFTQGVSVSKPIEASAATNITDPEDEVDLTGVDLNDPEAIAAAYALVGLRQSATLTNTLNPSITDYISFASVAVRGLEVSAANHISLSALAESVSDENVLSALQFVQTVGVDNLTPAVSALSLTQVLSSTGVVARSLTSALGLQDVVTFYRVGDLCDYDPGVGAGPAAPSMVDPVLTRRSTILLTYPFVASPTTTLELRNPQFDDVEQYEFRRINRKSRGGTLKVFRDSAWPASERLIYSFDNLKEAKKKELLGFLQATIGQNIGVLDYESRQWMGVIITPTTQAGDEDRAGNSVTFEFEGVQATP